MTLENYKHEDAKRRVIPTAEQQAWASEEKIGPKYLKYSRNADLDPQLLWRGKDQQNQQDLFLEAPPVYIQEKIHPRAIIERLEKQAEEKKVGSIDQLDLYGQFNGKPEEADTTVFYEHDQNWTNRMILGDSLLVMASLVARESLRGQVQCIYFDPPYGIKFNSNWQTKTSSRDVRDGKLEDRSREPEMIKAFRDTWRDGIHSYLSYLRDRLVVMRDLLHPTGSIFVQISDENVHVVRSLLDEVFGPDSFVVTILVKKKGSQISGTLDAVNDYILWYAASPLSTGLLKFKPQFEILDEASVFDEFPFVELGDGTRISIAELEKRDGLSYRTQVREFRDKYPDAKPFALNPLKSGGYRKNQSLPFSYAGRTFPIGANQCWKHTVRADEGSVPGMDRLAMSDRLHPLKSDVRFIRYAPQPLVKRLSNWWDGLGGASAPIYVVQTNPELVKRCILMGTDPGDLVLDPTCGSGTTAAMAEQWGRRWITIDTSRVAVTLARARIMGARFPFYHLADSEEGHKIQNELVAPDQRRLPPATFGKNIRHGFVYHRASWNTSGSIANNPSVEQIWREEQTSVAPLLASLNQQLGTNWEEWDLPSVPDEKWSDEIVENYERLREALLVRRRRIAAANLTVAEVEFLLDHPFEDRRKVRVSGPFTVESLSPHRVIPTGSDPFDDALPQDFESRARSSDETQFEQIVVEHLKRVGVHNGKKGETIRFETLTPRAGDGWVSFEGRYEDSRGQPRRAAIAIGPEYDAVGRDFMVRAQKEALRGLYDVLVVCGFQFAPDTDESRFDTRDLVVLKARMNQDIRMGSLLKDTGADKLFVVFGEPDIAVRKESNNQIAVEILGVDIFDPNTGELRSSSNPEEDIACWFIDDNYDDDSFFVRQAYFLNGRDSDPYAALKRALAADIDEQVWESLHSTKSRPFPRPETGSICVKVINHFGDEVQKVITI